MHTLHFAQNEQGNMYCPTCQSIYQKRKPMSTNRDDVTPTQTPKPERSSLVFMTFILLFTGVATIVAGAFLGLPWLAVAGLFHGLSAIALAVLSLRENK
jgi:hypothetical protein